MKKITLFLSLILLCFVSYSQSKVVNNYFEKYQSNESFSKVSINSKMFSLFSDLEVGGEEQEFLDVISKLEGIKAIVAEKLPAQEAKTLYKNALKEVGLDGFEELISVQDAEENIHISVKEERQIISELVVIVGGNENFVLLSLFGEIDLKKISKLASKMDIQGIKHLKKITDDHHHDDHHHDDH